MTVDGELPPCDIPNIGFGTLPFLVIAACVVALGLMVIATGRHRRLGPVVATILAIAAVAVATPSDASATSDASANGVLRCRPVSGRGVMIHDAAPTPKAAVAERATSTD